jgi:rare lipoprotein A
MLRVAGRRTGSSALESRDWRATGARSRVALTAAASASRGVARRRMPGPDGWLLALVVVAACGGAPHQAPPPRTGMATGVQRGLATFYGAEQQGGPTASGERFDRNKLTAAHRTLPLGTRVRVTNTRNGRSVEVRINDRGPYGKNRIIDLSEAAARRLDMIDAGVVPVTVEVLGDGGRR